MVSLGVGERLLLLCSGAYLLTKLLGWQLALLIGAVTTIVQVLLWMNQAAFWKNRGVPGPPSLIGWDLTAKVLKDGFHNCDAKWLPQYGNVYGSYFFGKPELIVADREYLKNILVKDFWNFTNRREIRDLFAIENKSIFTRMLTTLKDDEWKGIRNVITPSFTSGKMKAMLPMVQDCVETFCDILGSYADQGKPVDVKITVGNFTIDVIAAVAFGINGNNQRDTNNEFIRRIRDFGNFSFGNWRLILIMTFPSVFGFLARNFGVNFLFGDAEDYFVKHLKAVLAERRQNKVERPDFLQLLMNAANNNEKATEDKTTDVSTPTEKTKGTLDEFDILAQSFLFLFAGHETTAVTFTYVSFLLATNPDAQEQLHEEIKSVIGDEPCTYDHLQKLPYMEAVIQETLRMYPPAVRFDRKCLSDYQLNDKITIPAGTAVVVPVYAIHHNPEIYENPSKFDPTRFLNNENVNNSFEYFPFGSGPRNCVGMRFAQMELKLALAKVIKKFRIEPGAETQIPMQLMKTSNLLKPSKPVNLYFKRRE